MKILVYGSGVIGSIFGGKLAAAGHDVTMLARGNRLAELSRHGIILRQANRQQRETFRVLVTGQLLPDDCYDYILVVMQKTQIPSVLPVLAQNSSPNLVFVVNTASGYDEWVKAVGSKRLLLGFPSAGGTREHGVVSYFIGKGLLRGFQTTTFGEYDGSQSARLTALLRAFRRAGIPCVSCKDMDAWQKHHVAMVTAIANALYRFDSNNYALAQSRDTVACMVHAVREGFAVLRTLGYRVTPAKLHFFGLPAPLLTTAFQLFMRTQLAEITMAKHTAAAKQEMLCLQGEFDALIAQSRMKTAAIDSLKAYLQKGDFHEMVDSPPCPAALPQSNAANIRP